MREFEIDIMERVMNTVMRPKELYESEIQRALHFRHGVSNVIWEFFPFIILECDEALPSTEARPLTVVGALAVWRKRNVGYSGGFMIGVPWTERRLVGGLDSLLNESPQEKDRRTLLQTFAKHLKRDLMPKEERVATFLALAALPNSISVSRLLWCWLIEVPTPPENPQDPLVVYLAQKL